MKIIHLNVHFPITPLINHARNLRYVQISLVYVSFYVKDVLERSEEGAERRARGGDES